MRPGDFSPGNAVCGRRCDPRMTDCFNEAGGFLPRKRAASRGPASAGRRRFNEAGGFLPRKLPPGGNSFPENHEASMRPGDFSPGNRSASGMRADRYRCRGLQ